MFAKRIAAVVLIAASSLSAVAVAAPTEAHPANCILAQHRVTQVRPLHVSERFGRSTVERLAGAQVFIEAQPGLTAEWLQLTLQRHLLGMNGSMANCALDGKDVQVKVVSAGPGFSVQISGKSAAQGQEILRRAQLLVR